MPSVKQEAIDLVKHMPEDISWDDVMYEIYVRKKIELGLQAVKEGKVFTLEEPKKRLLK